MGRRDRLDDAFVDNRLSEKLMAPVCYGNPFILRLAGCYCDHLSFLLFCKGRRSPRALCIGQDGFNLPAVHGITQGPCLMFSFKTFKFVLAIVPTLTPTANGIPSNGIFASDQGL